MLSSEQIYDAVWQDDMAGGEHVVYNVICQLRRKLKNPDMIQRLSGEGISLWDRVIPRSSERILFRGIFLTQTV